MPKRASNGIVLVKLGGSLLTNKAKADTFRATVAKRLMRELDGIPNLVLVHGAGSFGHTHVKASGLGDGPLNAQRRAGATRTMRALADLERRFAAAAPAEMPLACVPLDGARRRAGRLSGFPGRHVKAAIAAGEIPVLHGSLVADDATGWSVLGGDDIMLLLAKALRPARVVFATDVDGVYDGDPSEAGARLLAAVGAGSRAGSAGRGTDVTGRMAGKLRSARRIARLAPTSIVNGAVPGRLAAAARGRTVRGTRILS